VTYKILYLPTGDYIQSIYNGNKDSVFLCESEEAAFNFVVSMCRKTKPHHSGLMAYNGVTHIAHFHIIEDTPRES
jgi:hypothetical protein